MSSLVAQGFKDLALPLLWRKLDPWPRNFCMLWAQLKKKKVSSLPPNSFLCVQLTLQMGSYEGALRLAE